MDEPVRVEGVSETNTALDGFFVDIQGDISKACVREAAKVMEAAIAERVPVKIEINGGVLPPNYLKNDLRVRIERLEQNGWMAIIDFKKAFGIARLVEYGHRLIKRSSKGSIRLHVKGGGMGVEVGDVPQHSFIRTAFEATVSQSVQAFAERFKRGIEKRRRG